MLFRSKYKVTKVADKLYVGKNILYINVFKRNDQRTIYNLVYQNGKGGVVYMKRFAVIGITRDKEYDMTQGTKGTKIWWFSANPNGEAETLRVTLKEKPRLKVLQFDINFADLAIKGKQAMGNMVTKTRCTAYRSKSAECRRSAAARCGLTPTCCV